jgi:hypothetical protein
VRVNYIDGNGTAENVTSALTAAVANVNDAPVGVPTITGTVTEDQTLTAVTTGITDADGLGAFGYQWLRNGVAIGGANAATYTLGDLDVGSQISVRVNYTDGNGTAENVTSALTAAVANVNDAPILQRNQALRVNEGASAVLNASNLLVSDVEATAEQLSYTIISPTRAGQLQAATAPGVIRSQFTQAELNAGLLQYVHDSSETVSDTFTFTVSDPQGAVIGSITFQIVINPQNDAPVLQTNSPAGLLYKGGLQTIDSAVKVSDVDSATLTQASIHISSQYVKGQDRLILSGTHPLVTQWSAEDATLTLSGAASAEVYATALSAVQFSSTDLDNKFREVIFAINDGALGSNSLQKSVEIGYIPPDKIEVPVFTGGTGNLNNGNAGNPGNSTGAGTGNTPSTGAVGVNPEGLIQPISRDTPATSGNSQSAEKSLFGNKLFGEETPFSELGNQASVLVQRQRAAQTLGEAASSSETRSIFDVSVLKVALNIEEVLTSLAGFRGFDMDFMSVDNKFNNINFDINDIQYKSFKINALGSEASGSVLNTSERPKIFLDVPAQSENVSDRVFNLDILSEPGVAGGLLVSSLVLWWATRAGGLLAAMMVSVPAWRSFDPLPILARSRDEQDRSDLKPDPTHTVFGSSRFSGELSTALRNTAAAGKHRSTIEELSGPV